MHQQRVRSAASRSIQRSLMSGASIYVLAFLLDEDILSTCCNKNDVM